MPLGQRCCDRRRQVCGHDAAPRARSRKAAIPEDWKAKPAKFRHKDRDARWTVKFSKAKERADGRAARLDNNQTVALKVASYAGDDQVEAVAPAASSQDRQDRRRGFASRAACPQARRTAGLLNGSGADA
jgi:hypothetical protein